MFPEIFRYSNKIILIGLQLKPLLYLFKLANDVPNLAKRQTRSARKSPIKTACLWTSRKSPIWPLIRKACSMFTFY